MGGLRSQKPVVGKPEVGSWKSEGGGENGLQGRGHGPHFRLT